MAKNYVIHAPQNDQAERLPYMVCEASVQFEQKLPISRDKGYYLYQIMQCVSGRGIFCADGKRFLIEPGDLVYFEPDVPHSYEADSDGGWILDWVSFKGDGMELLKKELSDGDNGYCIVRARDCRPIRQIVERQIILNADGATRGLLASSSELYGLLTELISFKKQLGDTSKMTERLKPVVDYMKQHLWEPFDIQQLCRIIQVSPSYLCRLFMKTYNTTPVRYGNNLKLISAAELLMRNPDMRVKDAAFRLGYQDVSYFCSEFKRLYSVTPAVYRRYYRDEG